MELKKNIKIVLISENRNYIEVLIDYFKEIPEVEVIQGELDPLIIINFIIENNPNLLVIDIEKLNILNVEEFKEISHSRNLNFKVILFSGNNLVNLFGNRTIKSADELFTTNDLKLTVNSIKNNNNLQNTEENTCLAKQKPISNKYIAFQTLIGLRFIDKKCVVYFEYTKDEKSEKSLWEAYLDNSEVIKLKLNTSSKDIMKHFEKHDFIQISQSNIVNMKFFSSIELKSRKCILHSPYDDKEMIISRAYLSELKNKFEID